MTFNIYLFSILLAALFGWSSWIIVINKLSPFESPLLALTFFYASLFIALTSSFALIGYYLRIWYYQHEVYFHHINTSLRQGALLASMSCLALVFQRMRVLTWWDGILLVALVVFIELFFMTKET